MESVWTTTVAVGLGAISTLIVQHISRGFLRRDQMLALRKQWISDVLDGLRVAWSAGPFDPENFDTFLPTGPPRALRFSDPSANRVSIWLSFRLHIMLSVLKSEPADETMTGPRAFFLYEEHMSRVEPRLSSWALGRYRYGPRAVERWLWASVDELDSMEGRASTSTEMRKLARRHTRVNRVRP